ncbi:BPSS1780 family membrane protein [Piscinibacter sp. XHJ-5]|uniref:BPSS1780 family membrane protein n=1 Tax=Piscinibacter sp. XHJ-5 TaxID=3037797 RepID=UPI0024536956|nr:BPSS1780 family membrane protein [Piscinibacter sp. XHJ-5]
MRLKLVPPRRGMVWVRDGLRVFLRKPLAFCVLFLVYLLVGPMLMLAVAPLASLGFMIATRQALEGRFPFPGVFLEPLQASRAQRWAQIRLGITYAIAVGLVFWLSDSVGGAAFDALRQAVSDGRTAPQELQPLLSDPSLQYAWLLLAGGVALIAIPFWHAPALVHWDGQSAVKSLFFSTVACWRNKGALTVFALGWGAVTMLLLMLAMTVFAVLGMPQLVFAAVTPLSLMLSAAFYASIYFSFVDSFEPQASTTPQETP